ncbi:MAG: nucleotidyl transferase AbiEii/AbiGii toxin family protein [Flavobacteriaceae bacterium]|nr:nucleotidyl transferase AbiEii/AbiGii toxin family protein [Flavobacteriaceae bacterium]MCY4268112.1 nucleotidyl transferase AbiEii/AbiGii toxin family protein [Flavobacteriaceae bacterium]MCY4299479.1 nucleotidyl transferase AbiEii/AbiGii toxin family protein [Flavobacteriaceae bacterium]
MSIEAVSGRLKTTMIRLQNCQALKDFGLAGGTNVALRLNHRVSTDIDLFCHRVIGEKGYAQIKQEFIDVLKIKPEKYTFSFSHNKEHFGASRLRFPISNKTEIKVDILDNVKRLDSLEVRDGFRLLSLKDVGVLKLIALGGRVHKKDFYDLDHITDIIPLVELMEGLEERLAKYPYPQYDSFLEMNSMGYPTKRSKLLLSYIELYPGAYDHMMKKQTIEQVDGKTWEESERSWIDKSRDIIYGNSRYPQDILSHKIPSRTVDTGLKSKSGL